VRVAKLPWGGSREVSLNLTATKNPYSHYGGGARKVRVSEFGPHVGILADGFPLEVFHGRNLSSPVPCGPRSRVDRCTRVTRPERGPTDSPTLAPQGDLGTPEAPVVIDARSPQLLASRQTSARVGQSNGIRAWPEARVHRSRVAAT
jgi:hypothetical protein